MVLRHYKVVLTTLRLCGQFASNNILTVGAWINTSEQIVKPYMPALPKECMQINAWQAKPAGLLHPAWRWSHGWQEENLSRTKSLFSALSPPAIRWPQHCHKSLKQVQLLLGSAELAIILWINFRWIIVIFSLGICLLFSPFKSFFF